MKGKVLIITILLALISAGAYAGFRFDIGITVPAYVGVQFDTGEEVGDWMDYTFVVPDLQFYYIFDLGLVKLGAGIRAYTLIIESLLMPSFVAEVDLDPLLLHASAFGGAFIFFGLWNHTATEEVGVIDLNVSYKFREWFALGVGVLAFGEYDPVLEMGATPFVLYVFGKFSFYL